MARSSAFRAFALFVLFHLCPAILAQTDPTDPITTTIPAPTLTSTITPSSVATTFPQPSGNDSSWTSDSQFQDDVLNSTNTWRTNFNADALQWNTSLASVAQNLTDKCDFRHSDSGDGENLAFGFLNVTAAIESWGREVSDFDFGNPHFTEKTGHFSQLVWKASTSIGCARTFCDSVDDHDADDCDDHKGDNQCKNGNGNSTNQDGHNRLRRDDGDGGHDDHDDDDDDGDHHGSFPSGWLLACEFSPAGNVKDQFQNNVNVQVANGNSGVIGSNSQDSGQIGGGATPEKSYALVVAAVVASLFVRGLM